MTAFEGFSLVLVAILSTVVLAAAYSVNLCLRRRSAAIRHGVWTTAFVIVLVTPALRFLLPELEIAILPSAPVSVHTISTSTHESMISDLGPIETAQVPSPSENNLLGKLWLAGVV